MLPKIDLVAAVLGLATSRQVSFPAQGPAVLMAWPENGGLAGAIKAAGQATLKPGHLS